MCGVGGHPLRVLREGACLRVIRPPPAGLLLVPAKVRSTPEGLPSPEAPGDGRRRGPCEAPCG
jgi:hypothetical protein